MRMAWGRYAATMAAMAAAAMLCCAWAACPAVVAGERPAMQGPDGGLPLFFGEYDGHIYRDWRLKEDYSKLRLMDGGVLLSNDNSRPHCGYQCMILRDAAFLNAFQAPAVVAFRLRVKSFTEGVPGAFIAILALPVPDGSRRSRTLMMRLEADGVTTEIGKVAYPAGFDPKAAFHDYRMEMDAATGMQRFFLDGVEVHSGQGRIGSGKPSLFFGDGSGSVGGEVVLEYLAVGVE